MSAFDDLVASVEGDAATPDTADNSLETGAEQVTETGEAAAEPVDGEPPAFDPSSLAPELQTAYKAMQADYTRKTQQLAEQRRQFEGIDPQAAQAARTYQDLLQQNPAQAAEWLRQQSALVEQQFGLQQPPDPFGNVNPITPTEEALLQVTRQLWQQHQESQRYIQQQQFQAGKATVDRTFAELEQLAGRKIPLEERELVAQRCVATGCRDVGLIWKALNFDKAAGVGAQRAAAVTQKKAAQPAGPQGKVSRAGAAPAAPAKGITGHFEAALKQFGG